MYYVAKTKGLISCVVTTQLICKKKFFSHEAAHILNVYTRQLIKLLQGSFIFQHTPYVNYTLCIYCYAHSLDLKFISTFRPSFLYPRHLCRRVYSFRLSVRPFVSSFVLPSHSWNLRQSFSCGVYLSNYSSESIHIWTIVTLEGWHSLHDHGPQGPCPGVGPEVKI